MKVEIIRPAVKPYISESLGYGDIIEVIYHDGGPNFYLIIQPEFRTINFIDLNYEFGNRFQDNKQVEWESLDTETIIGFLEIDEVKEVKKVKGKLTLTIEE